jgi:hypothetical protein
METLLVKVKADAQAEADAASVAKEQAAVSAQITIDAHISTVQEIKASLESVALAAAQTAIEATARKFDIEKKWKERLESLEGRLIASDFALKSATAEIMSLDAQLTDQVGTAYEPEMGIVMRCACIWLRSMIEV